MLNPQTMQSIDLVLLLTPDPMDYCIDFFQLFSAGTIAILSAIDFHAIVQNCERNAQRVNKHKHLTFMFNYGALIILQTIHHTV